MAGVADPEPGLGAGAAAGSDAAHEDHARLAAQAVALVRALEARGLAVFFGVACRRLTATQRRLARAHGLAATSARSRRPRAATDLRAPPRRRRSAAARVGGGARRRGRGRDQRRSPRPGPRCAPVSVLL